MLAAPIRTERLDLVSMSPAFIEALLDGRRAEAESAGGFAIPDRWPDGDDERFLRLRLRQLNEHPDTEPWLAKAMALRGPGRPMVGFIGFHNLPVDGAAELGYTVMAGYRRRGYAVEAALGLMEWARRGHGVRRFIVSVSPANAPSLAMAAKLGFRQAGEQMDPEGGLELVFELLRE